jgi:uncharacterized surface protein with fasciclin (FAS1) repeats
MKLTPTRKAALGLLVAAALGLAACGSDDSSSSAPTTSQAMATTTAAKSSGTTAMSSGAAAMSMTGDTFGPACSSVPTSGSGSFAGMAQDPAATAASNNPELATLVSAVKAAGLVDTLNGPGPFTIFAPANAAFAKIPSATLTGVMADPSGALTKILTYHVVAGQELTGSMLAEMGTLKTVEGDTLTVAKSGDTLTVNGSASVVCGNVKTANATVFIIDSVLMPM